MARSEDYSWFHAFFLIVFAVGPLLVFLYALFEGKEKWYVAAVCTHALVWGLFEYMLETRWPRGLFFS